MEELPQLTFSVRYRLSEYLSFASEHAFATEQALRNLTGIKRCLARASLKSIATPMFLYKSVRVEQCHFKIDPVSISRRSNGGDGIIAWSKVKAVYTYTPGYLIETQSGAMPVPFRVLSTEQLNSFRLLAGELIGEVPQPNKSFKPKPLRGSA